MRTSLQRLFAAYVPKGNPAMSAAASINISSSSSLNPHEVTAAFRQAEAAAAEADAALEGKGFFYLPRLDYDTASGVAPLMSKSQFDVQYNVFHRDAVDRLNQHTLGSDLEGHNLEVVIRKTAFNASQAVVHTAASEHFNYCFWYRSLRPWGTSVPSRLKEELQLQFSRNGTIDAVAEVQRLLTVCALSQQSRSGWVYLVWTGKMFDVVEFRHGTCPIGSGLTPLVCINLHESAMRHDYTAPKGSEEGLAQYLQNHLKTCNWNLAERYFLMATDRS